MRCSLSFLLLMMVVAPASTFAQTNSDRQGAISGKVLDIQTLEPLIGVNLLIEKSAKGTASDMEGHFLIPKLEAGIYNLVVRYIGYETQILTDIVVGSNRTQNLEIKLSPAAIEGEEIRVTSGYFSNDTRDGVTSVSFTPEELRRSPGAAQDVGRVLNALPSVVSKGETSQDLLVRGGSPSENGFYIDNIPMPEVRHFSFRSGGSNGPLGIINSDLVSDIEFSAGGYSAKYGNHLSSVSDITYREGNHDRLRGDIGANMAGFTLNMDGPVSDRTTFLASARRSYLDIIAEAINAGGAPSFSDAQAKVTTTLNQKNRLSFLNILGTSLFKSDLEDAREDGLPQASRLGNFQNTTGINWRHLWGSGYTNTSLSYSFKNQDQRLRDTITGQTDVNFESREAMAVLRSVSYFKLNPKMSIEFGAEIRSERNDFDYYIAAKTNSSGEERPDFFRDDEVNGSISSAFGSYSVQLTEKLTTTAGLRIGYTSYNEDVNLSPRFSARYQITPRLGANATAGIYYQTIPRYLISQNEALAGLKNTRADHYIAGIDYLLTDDTKLTLEVFDKEYRNAPILPADNSVSDRNYILDSFQQFYDVLEDGGRAYARGIELLIQKKLAVDFYGMISASVFRTRHKDYSGTWQDRSYDNRYLFSVIGGYRPNDLWEVSIRWSLLGGAAYTPIDAAASAEQNTEILDQSRFNEERYPDYHSLFVRIDRRFFLRQTNWVIFLEVWNVYNHANVQADYWNINTQEIDQLTQFSLLPVGGVKFEF